jgi:hypothetical protein
MDQREKEPPRKKELSDHDKEIAREGEENRRKMDQVPPPGTDPLHEGP